MGGGGVAGDRRDCRDRLVRESAGGPADRALVGAAVGRARPRAATSSGAQPSRGRAAPVATTTPSSPHPQLQHRERRSAIQRGRAGGPGPRRAALGSRSPLAAELNPRRRLQRPSRRGRDRGPAARRRLRRFRVTGEPFRLRLGRLRRRSARRLTPTSGVQLLVGRRVDDRIAVLGHASAAASNSSSGPVPITFATSSSSNTSGARSTQSPCAAHALSSISTV